MSRRFCHFVVDIVELRAYGAQMPSKLAKSAGIKDMSNRSVSQRNI